MEISFSNHRDLDHYEKLHPALRDVLAWLHEYLPKSKTSRLVYTSIFRNYKKEIAQGRSGLHGLQRAADIVAIHTDGKPYTQQDYDAIGMLLNCVFYYGDGGKHHVAVSAPHGTGPHIHLQVRNETQKRIVKENENG